MSVVLVAVIVIVAAAVNGPRFFDDDPVWKDDDTVFDASGAKPIDLSESYDFIENTFRPRKNGDPGPSSNVNTVDEVPDSSWFTNRIGRRPMSVAEIVRGPDRVERLDIDEWVVVGTKGPAGFQPGFRAVDPRNPDQWYQLEVDPRGHAELATGAEIIGTAIYHAIGYNVVDTYLVNVDPSRVAIGENVVIEEGRGTRPFDRSDLDEVFRFAARNPDGTYRMSAGRFVEGKPLGSFKHHGTRPDDPNDVHPHEHRRELRANRVFAAWLNHDDSRAVNTLDMLVQEDGRRFIRHYMFDFGSVLGSTPGDPGGGREYWLEARPAIARLLSFGLWVPAWESIEYPGDLPAVGHIEGAHFDPALWKPSYPNPAFANMRPDDAFWAARIVSRFSDEALAAVVSKAHYKDPRAGKYLTEVLIERRNKVVAHWLTGVNPLVEFALSSSGEMTFQNAAEEAGVLPRETTYRVQWARFDNAAGVATDVGGDVEARVGRIHAPPELVSTGGAEYVEARIASFHRKFPSWKTPVKVHFRRLDGGWQTVGIARLPG
ncbi:MAG: hypothetical protein ACE148_14920 [Vicinamibacterales bacterium]